MIKNPAQAIDVAVTAYLAVPGRRLLRRHEVGRAEHLATQRQTGLALQALGQAEIGDARLVVGVDEHIRWFEVAVQDALLMRVVDRFGNGLEILSRAPGRQRNVPHQGGQTGAIHEIHREIVLAGVDPDFMDRDDVRMVQHRRRRGLGAKTLHERLGRELAGEDHLHRHEAIQADLPGFVHHPHAAAGDLFEQLVIAKGAESGQ